LDPYTPSKDCGTLSNLRTLAIVVARAAAIGAAIADGEPDRT